MIKLKNGEIGIDSDIIDKGKNIILLYLFIY